MATEPKPRGSSLFWPIILIGAGTVWLLSNFQIIPEFNQALLWQLWPIILIGAGVDLMLARGNAWIGALAGLLTVAVVVGLLMAGPALGLPTALQLRTERLTAAVDNASAARVELDLSSFGTTIDALTDAATLLDAELTHDGNASLSVSGSQTKDVRLRFSRVRIGLGFPSISTDACWHIGLSPRVALDLNVDSGSGSVEMNLADLNLTRLAVDGGSGSIHISLPASDTPYAVSLDTGSGSTRIVAPQGSAGSVAFDGGSGSLLLETAAGAAVRVEVRDGGSGSINLPAGWQRLSGEDDEGVWQSPGFDNSARQVTLVVNRRGSGSITVR